MKPVKHPKKVVVKLTGCRLPLMFQYAPLYATVPSEFMKLTKTVSKKSQPKSSEIEVTDPKLSSFISAQRVQQQQQLPPAVSQHSTTSLQPLKTQPSTLPSAPPSAPPSVPPSAPLVQNAPQTPTAWMSHPPQPLPPLPGNASTPSQQEHDFPVSSCPQQEEYIRKGMVGDLRPRQATVTSDGPSPVQDCASFWTVVEDSEYFKALDWKSSDLSILNIEREEVYDCGPFTGIAAESASGVSQAFPVQQAGLNKSEGNSFKMRLLASFIVCPSAQSRDHCPNKRSHSEMATGTRGRVECPASSVDEDLQSRVSTIRSLRAAGLLQRFEFDGGVGMGTTVSLTTHPQKHLSASSSSSSSSSISSSRAQGGQGSSVGTLSRGVDDGEGGGSLWNRLHRTPSKYSALDLVRDCDVRGDERIIAEWLNCEDYMRTHPEDGEIDSLHRRTDQALRIQTFGNDLSIASLRRRLGDLEAMRVQELDAAKAAADRDKGTLLRWRKYHIKHSKASKGGKKGSQ